LRGLIPFALIVTPFSSCLSCSKADALLAVEALADSASQPLWQWLGPASAVQMLHHLHALLDHMQHPAHKARPLAGLEALLNLLGDGVRKLFMRRSAAQSRNGIPDVLYGPSHYLSTSLGSKIETWNLF
jgi:hypothetical protein